MTRQAAWRSPRRVDEGSPRTQNTPGTAAKGLHPHTSFTAGPMSSDVEAESTSGSPKLGLPCQEMPASALLPKTLREQDSNRGAGLGGQLERGLSPPPGAPFLTGSSGS